MGWISFRTPFFSTLRIAYWRVSARRHLISFNTFDYLKYTIQKRPCPMQCTFSGDQSLWRSADVVLFEPQPFGRRGDKWPPGKICGQKWLMFSYETALYPLSTSRSLFFFSSCFFFFSLLLSLSNRPFLTLM